MGAPRIVFATVARYDGRMQARDVLSAEAFIITVGQHYAKEGRHDLPWRLADKGGTFDPYKILVSEIMLQQTQVPRVVEKYRQFLMLFPTVQALAAAEPGDVLRAWQGLGYNRRALYLWRAGQQIAVADHFPDTVDELTALPGVGVNTAGAVLVYAYNKRAVFIETNIRTACIHHFTRDGQTVSDDFVRGSMAAILEAYERDWAEHRAIFSEGRGGEEMSELNAPVRYRAFYWALMDYGSWLKKHVRNNAQSQHYRKQGRFNGSRRQIRGRVIELLRRAPHTKVELAAAIEDERLGDVLAMLESEDMIRQKHERYSL